MAPGPRSIGPGAARPSPRTLSRATPASARVLHQFRHGAMTSAGSTPDGGVAGHHQGRPSRSTTAPLSSPVEVQADGAARVGVQRAGWCAACPPVAIWLAPSSRTTPSSISLRTMPGHRLRGESGLLGEFDPADPVGQLDPVQNDRPVVPPQPWEGSYRPAATSPFLIEPWLWIFDGHGWDGSAARKIVNATKVQRGSTP